MSWPLFENLSEIGRRLKAAQHVLLFLDFDGTLAPIVERPEMARLSPETKNLLFRLSRRDDMTVALISGRSLSDIQERVGIENMIYAGNHGLEISGPKIHFVHSQAAAQQEPLRQLSELLSNKLRHIAGAKVELKGLTTSIHYRRVAPAEVNAVTQIVHTSVLRACHLFRLTAGKKVHEIRPRVDWHKGAAVRWIRERLGNPNSLSIYLGDDTTDENAFVELQHGITVKIGISATTQARLHLADHLEVQKFLYWLEETVKR